MGWFEATLALAVMTGPKLPAGKKRITKQIAGYSRALVCGDCSHETGLF